MTEPCYFREFRHHAKNQRVHVELADEPGVPLTVVQTAIRLREQAEADASKQRDENLRFDSTWAVFDVDSHPNLDEARALAARSEIHVAISNPCFEVWALLHFEEQRAHVERHIVASRLRDHIPGYEKLLPYEKLHARYAQALMRAQSLDSEAVHHDAVGRNPSTGVYKLTELIRTQ